MNKRFLIVDDSGTVRQLASRLLRGFGFETIEAGDGRVACGICRTQMPHAILLDWNMPVMNGIETLRQVRDLPGGDRPVVIFCTTESEVEKIRQALDGGANEYIMKPFDAEILEAKLTQVGLL